VLEGIHAEREHLIGLRECADRLFDTSDFNVHQLRLGIVRLYSPRKRLDQLVIHILSFGFKYGVPADANLVLDVRFLPNPFFESELRSLNGCAHKVRNYVLEKEDTIEFLKYAEDLLKFLIPKYRDEGKSYLVIAVGCTGGRHRSVAIVEHLKEIDKNGKVYIARENSVCIYFQSNLDESEKKIVEHLENNSYSSCGLHKFYGSTIKLNNKIQKTIKSSFQTSSSVSNKMLVDECNLVLISSSGRLYNACEGNSYIICVSNNIFPDVIPLTPNTKIYRFWWD